MRPKRQRIWLSLWILVRKSLYQPNESIPRYPHFTILVPQLLFPRFQRLVVADAAACRRCRRQIDCRSTWFHRRTAVIRRQWNEASSWWLLVKCQQRTMRSPAPINKTINRFIVGSLAATHFSPSALRVRFPLRLYLVVCSSIIASDSATHFFHSRATVTQQKSADCVKTSSPIFRQRSQVK